MVDRPSNAFQMIKDVDCEKKIYEKVMYKEAAFLEDKILNTNFLLKQSTEQSQSTSDKG